MAFLAMANPRPVPLECPVAKGSKSESSISKGMPPPWSSIVIWQRCAWFCRLRWIVCKGSETTRAFSKIAIKAFTMEDFSAEICGLSSPNCIWKSTFFFSQSGLKAASASIISCVIATISVLRGRLVMNCNISWESFSRPISCFRKRSANSCLVDSSSSWSHKWEA